MLYLALLTGDEDEDPPPGTPEFDAAMAGYERFGEVAGPAILGGEALLPTAQATTVRAGEGEDGPLVTGGPFAEAVEAIGGFYVFDVATLDDAIDLARQIPVAEYGAVEVRPMAEWGQEDPAARDQTLDRYLALIIAPESGAEQPGTPEWDAGAAEHTRFGEEAGSALVGGGALHPAATATTVRVRDGEVLVTDGPHSETTEVVGGLYLFATAAREAATALAARVPLSPGGAVELRPIMEVDG